MTAQVLEKFRALITQPLYVHIVLILILLIVTLGGGQIWFNYQKNTELIEESLAILYDKTTQQVYRNLQTNYDIAANNVEIMAEGWLVDAQNLEQRLRYLPLLSKALKVNNVVSSYSVGYDNGDFFMVRAAFSDWVRERLDTPENTRYVVDNLSTDINSQRVRLIIYFDKDLQEISRRFEVGDKYDPRERSWYQQATASDKPITTAPFMFYFLKSPGTSIAIASKRSPGNVIAADISLVDLSQSLTDNKITASSELMLLHETGTVLAYPQSDQLVIENEERGREFARVSNIDSSVIEEHQSDIEPVEKRLRFEHAGEQWGGAISKFQISEDFKLFMVLIAPDKELFPRALEIRQQLSIITVILILLSLPVIFFSAYKVTQPLRDLILQTRRIRRFDFSPRHSTYSPVSEISTLANDMEAMKQTISHFLNMLNALSGEKNLDSLIETITRQTLVINQADAAVLYMFNEEGDKIEPACVLLSDGDADHIELASIDVDHQESFIVHAINRKGARLHGLRCSSEEEREFSPIFKELGSDILEVLTLPLNNRSGETTGILCVLNREDKAQIDSDENIDHIAFMQSLSGFAAVSIESKHSLKAQQDLLASFIKLIAGAIDAKSHHTAGHCSRVPVITRMLAEQVNLQDSGEFRDYKLSEEEFEELDIAAWLHDCGKITTPEYVVDKATKLETIYDRIHEIRMRFEVLKRDAQIGYYKALQAGGSEVQLARELSEKIEQIDDDFSFVAQCNIGQESMSEKHLDRLRSLSKLTWQRTLDDSKGVSLQELQRKKRSQKSPLPVAEFLLDDREDHIIERQDDSEYDGKPARDWGFNMIAPEHQYNRGELHNLSVAQGTLTKEERYVINEHITQTIMMLTRLKFPNNLKNVIEIAGGHHERMNGAGYPRGLKRDELSVSTRIMAIADIFEALTARDRPYKRAKSLGEALDIMYELKCAQHIDGELFDIFLKTGVYQTYADKYLPQHQIEYVDISKYLSR